MTDEEKLAKIIKDNPGADAFIDNDHWTLHKPVPPEYENWTETEQMIWYDECELACSNDFPSLSCVYGYGLLEAMALILKINIDGV